MQYSYVHTTFNLKYANSNIVRLRMYIYYVFYIQNTNTYKS